MHLALVTPGYPRNATDPFAPYWPGLVAALAATGAYRRISVFALRYPDHRGPYACGAAVVYPAGFGDLSLRESPRIWASTWQHLSLVHRRAPIDVIHALTLGEAGFVGAVAARFLGIPLASHLHGGELTRLDAIDYGSYRRWNERLQVRVCLAATRLVSAGSRQAMAAVGRKASYAPYGVDARHFVPAPEAPQADARQSAHHSRDSNGARLCHVGDLNPVKDQQTLLAALRRVVDLGRGLEPTLSVIGGGRLAGALRRSAEMLGVAGRVRWLGRVPNRALVPHFQAARGYVAISLHESQGLALIEAASSGLPIVSTPVGAALDLPGEGTKLTPLSNADAAALAILEWLEDPASARIARQANREAVERGYDWPVCAGRWLSIHRSLTRGQGLGAA